MENERTVKIILDADVIIHFAKGEMLSLLPEIFPECEFILLNIVKTEILQPILGQLMNQVMLLRNIREVVFGETNEEKLEYARLQKACLGRGESACMVYCRYHHDVIGSSNLRDITKYCNEHGITYLTTNDFLFYGIRRGAITEAQALEFIEKVNSKGSRLPKVDFSMYVDDKLMKKHHSRNRNIKEPASGSKYFSFPFPVSTASNVPSPFAFNSASFAGVNSWNISNLSLSS